MKEEIRDGMNSETDKDILNEFLNSYDPNTYSI